MLTNLLFYAAGIVTGVMAVGWLSMVAQAKAEDGRWFHTKERRQMLCKSGDL